MATLLSSQILFRFNLLSGLRRRSYRQRSVVKISWAVNVHRVYRIRDDRLGEFWFLWTGYALTGIIAIENYGAIPI